MSSSLIKQDNKTFREFGWVFGGIVSLLFGLLLPWLFAKPYPLWPWLVALLVIVPAVFEPRWLRWPYLGWMWFGEKAGWINTRLLMGMTFFFLILPLGLLMRLVGKQPMAFQRKGERDSFRVPSQVRDSKHVERPF